MDGLGEDYFVGISDTEKAAAWDFLEAGYATSVERINWLYQLNRGRAVKLFQTELKKLPRNSPYADQRKEYESARLLMLKLVNDVELSDLYLDMMCNYANSEFPSVRGQFVDSLPSSLTNPRALSIIRGMVLTEVERSPLASAIEKLMELYGMPFDIGNSVYDEVFQMLFSSSVSDKQLGLKKLGLSTPET